MKTRCLLICLVICGTTATLSADPLRYPYWQMIKEIVSNVEAQPPRPISISDSNHKSDIEYPFETLRHLRATDLLRAAVEGAEEARLQAALGKPEIEIEAIVLSNVALALEYLPMLVRSDSDIEEIALLMAKREQDKMLRLYLLQNSFPEFAAPSFLSKSLSEVISINDEVFSKWTLHIASHPMEHPELQAVALRIYYAKLLQEYKSILESDPLLGELMATSENQEIVHFARQNEPVLSEDTATALKMCRRKFHDFAFEIAGHISTGSIRDDQVKAITRNILEDMRDTIIGISAPIMDTFLEGKPFTSTPFPQLPTGEDDVETEVPQEALRLDELLEQKLPSQ